MRRLATAALFLLCLIHCFAFELIERKLVGSDIYPSTVHKYSVSFPDGYDGSEACLYIGLDGILCDAPHRIDSLIAVGDLPSMIGIYLEPGLVCDSTGTVLRYNRSNEFDAIDSRFYRFLSEELIPHAMEAVNSEGRHVCLKSGAENSMIFGLSSGGIAAFVAAWHGSELFGKVFSGCGTFVPMRGGNELQALVRKSEPRRIKVFLQDGYSDSWNPLFGSWFEANAMLGTALDFAGYNCDFDWAEGGHSLRRSNEIFVEVLKWLWKDYPNMETGGQSKNDSLATWLKNAGEWEVADVVAITDFPAGTVYPDGSLCVKPNKGSNYLWQYLISDNGIEYAGQPFYWLHNYKNSVLQIGAMDFDGDGNLWVLTDAGIQICDQNGRVRGILRLPGNLENILWRNPQALEQSAIKILDGRVVIQVDGEAWQRVLNTKSPQKGIRPQSQGQA